MNPAVSQSLLMAKHLRSRDPENPAWVQGLDRCFLGAAFEDRSTEPFTTGPDGLSYYAFHSARNYDVEFLDFPTALSCAIHWAIGGVVYPGGGQQEWVYSPGDLVSLSLHQTSAFQWTGDWGLPPKLPDYMSGESVSVLRPNLEFVSPLAARCLESVLRRIYRAEPTLRDRIPGIAVLRPESRTRPEQASELIINAFRDDFADDSQAESFPVLVKQFLPRHLGRRIISFESRLFPDERFTPLVELIAEGNLERVPEPPTE